MAQCAMTLNKENMGARYIELYRVSRGEALQYLCFAGVCV